MAWLSLEELKKYDAKKELKKMGQAEKSAASLRSGGQPVEVVRDTGAKDAVKNLLEQRKKSRVIRKEMQSIGQDLRKNKSTDLAAYRRVAQKQAELQKKLPGAAFTAGLLEGMGGNSKDAAVKLIGNDALTKQNEAMQELFKQTQSNHKGMAAAGRLTGEFAKAGAGYMTIGKAAEEATLKGMGALGRRMTASTAPDIAQKAAAKILLNPKNAKAARVAAGLLGQQAADTMVNTPMTIAAGMADGKSRREIAKDIGKQEATDAAFNMGLAALGAGAKKVGDVLEPRLAAKRIPKQIEKSMTGKMKPNEYIKLGKTPEILKKYGMIEGEMLMPQGVVPKVAYPAGYQQALAKGTGMSENQIKKIQGHDLGFEVIRQIPEKMRNPIAILKSDTQEGSIVVLTDMVDKYNQPIIVPIKVDQKGYSEFASVIPSMYGRKGFTEFMEKQEKKGNILYWNKKKNLQHFPESGVQFPDSYSDADPMLRIAQRKGIVNAEELKNIQKGHKLQAAEGVKEADAAGKTVNTAREETIQAAAQSMAENRNVLAERMTKAERQKMEAELAQLNSAEYRNAKLKEIDEKTGGDPKAIREATRAFEERKQELTKLLTTQETLRTEKGILRDVADEVGSIFNLQGKRSRQQISDALQQVMLEAKEGSISEKTRNELFEQLFRISGESKTGTYGLKKKLREKKLLLGVDAAADIADITTWNHKMKGVLGKIKIGRDTNITPFYNELRRDFPAYFPEGIDNEAEQLRQIRKIAEKLKGNIGLGKSDYQANFNRALDRLTDTMAVKKAYGEKVAAKADAVHSNLLGKIDYGKVTTDEVRGWHKERYRLQKAAERQKNADLSQMEKNALRDMLDGNVPEVQVQKYLGSRYALVKQQYDIQKPLHDVEEKIIEHKRFVAAKRHKEAAEVIGDIHLKEGAGEGWKDKAIALGYGRETQERNLYDIAPNEKKAKEIIDWAFTPIHENERKRVLMINDSAQALEKLKIDTRNNLNIQLPEVDKKKISESALVQYLGEKEFALRQAQASGAPAESYAELQKEIANIRGQLRPEQQERIDKGIVFLQKAYKKLHGMVNEVLIRNGFDPIGYIDGYFPHMNFDDPKDPLLQMAQAMGIDVAAKELPMDIAGRTETFRPRKRWSGNLLERKGTQTDYDALRAFDQYLATVSDVIYHTDDIGRIRSMAEYFRYNLSDEGIKKQIDELRKKKPKTEEELEEIKDQIAKKYADGDKNRKMQNYVNNLELYANLLAGKKHDLDRAFEKHGTGRSYYRVIDNISNKVAGNMVAGNIGSALTNLIPATQSMARMSIGSNLRGLKESLVNMAKSDMDELTRRSAFLATRGGTERTYKNWLQKLQETGGNLNPLQWMEAADKFTTQAVWRSRYYDNLKKGMTEDAAI